MYSISLRHIVKKTVTVLSKIEIKFSNGSKILLLQLLKSNNLDYP